ncbi:hypothetical protein E0L01_05360 [Megamonas funiformis]|uniref:gp53-like domain-containing protein n=1 Tax=Megamonas funiformis TaxID=437897 RepID=UPI001431A845|nr:hypothetical protein [Megamonas funiformis]NJE28194.1 hypothetical protein [Megamonas funiformis]
MDSVLFPNPHCTSTKQWGYTENINANGADTSILSISFKNIIGALVVNFNNDLEISHDTTLQIATITNNSISIANNWFGSGAQSIAKGFYIAIGH